MSNALVKVTFSDSAICTAREEQSAKEMSHKQSRRQPGMGMVEESVCQSRSIFGSSSIVDKLVKLASESKYSSVSSSGIQEGLNSSVKEMKSTQWLYTAADCVPSSSSCLACTTFSSPYSKST